MELFDFEKKYHKKLKKIKTKGGVYYYLIKILYKDHYNKKYYAEKCIISLYSDMIWYQFFPKFHKPEDIDRIKDKFEILNDIIEKDKSLIRILKTKERVHRNYMMAVEIITRRIEEYYKEESTDIIPINYIPKEYDFERIVNEYAMELFLTRYK